MEKITVKLSEFRKIIREEMKAPSKSGYGGDTGARIAKFFSDKFGFNFESYRDGWYCDKLNAGDLAPLFDKNNQIKLYKSQPDAWKITLNGRDIIWMTVAHDGDKLKLTFKDKTYNI